MGRGGVFDGRGKAGACSGARAGGVFEITEPTAFGRGKAGVVLGLVLYRVFLRLRVGARARTSLTLRIR